MSLLTQNKNARMQQDPNMDNEYEGMEGMGQVGRPDWMENPDSSDEDDKALGNNRNNFDLKMPESRMCTLFQTVIYMQLLHRLIRLILK